MVKIKVGLGIILVMVAISGCANKTTDVLDYALNGTWIFQDFDVEGGDPEDFIANYSIFVFNNGYFETSMSGTPATKGIYTTNIGKIVLTLTHTNVNESLGLESKLYSKDELREALIAIKDDLGMSETEIDNDIEGMFSAQTFEYSISSNILTLIQFSPDKTIIITAIYILT